MSNTNNNRRSFRVVEDTRVLYQEISEADYDGGYQQWIARRGLAAPGRADLFEIDDKIRSSLTRVQSECPIVAELFSALNRKVDVLMLALPEVRETIDALAGQPIQPCQLSADGIVFGSEFRLRAPGYLVLRFLLDSESRYFEVFCRVVRCEDAGENTQREFRYNAAVEFTWDNPAQRDALIQLLFERQSEHLRELRRANAEQQ